VTDGGNERTLAIALERSVRPLHLGLDYRHNLASAWQAI
jgi:hypothetical protein